MKHHEDDEILAQINIIPLVDVSLVLLIIFIVTVGHILTPPIEINLPQSKSARGTIKTEVINVFISNEGVIYLEKNVVTLKDLKDRLDHIYKKNPEAAVTLNVDKSTYFQRVVDVLDVLNGLGIKKLNIQTSRN
ncbi:MAG: biopolymer transporter ExbD [Candidatus Omnitrophica bacterium]|nr:biopolymer transporter ExbD [Candidatus Omnitrophota bacterium]